MRALETVLLSAVSGAVVATFFWWFAPERAAHLCVVCQGAPVARCGDLCDECNHIVGEPIAADVDARIRSALAAEAQQRGES